MPEWGHDGPPPDPAGIPRTVTRAGRRPYGRGCGARREPARRDGVGEERGVDDERFVGIDVAKGWLDIAERPGGVAFRVANDPDGWAELVARYGD